MTKTIKIATRRSALAMKQTQMVKDALLSAHPHLKIELVSMSTQGDRQLDQSLAKIGGKGLFVKELEQALLNETADFAVHSMKDVPYQQPKGLHIEAILKRTDPRDALISVAKHTTMSPRATMSSRGLTTGSMLPDLPQSARIGTSSLRRQLQLKQHRPDLTMVDIRGNVQTRLKKLEDGVVDAVVLAVAGLKRLVLEDAISEYFSIDTMLPAAGQGAIGVECRSQDTFCKDLLTSINHQETYQCVMAERAVTSALQASCSTPLAAYAVSHTGVITLKSQLFSWDGSQMIEALAQGDAAQYQRIGADVAKQLLEQGGDALLKDHLC